MDDIVETVFGRAGKPRPVERDDVVWLPQAMQDPRAAGTL